MGIKIYKKPQDIFNLNYNKIKNLDGWGSQSVQILKFSIENSKKVTLHKFIFSIGIRHIGIENAKLISDFTKNLKSLLNFIKKNKFDKFLNIDGIGETQIKSLKNFFQNKTNIKVIDRIK